MPKPNSPRPDRRRNLRRRPELEVLEDRWVPAFFSVTGTADDAGSVITAGHTGTADDPYLATTLRAAIFASEATPGADVIVFDPHLTFAAPQTINLTTSINGFAGPAAFEITDTLSIIGSAGQNGITLARDAGAANMRLFSIATGGSLSLDSLTLSGGRAIGGNGGPDGGGGGGAGLGGAIFNMGSLTLLSSTLSGNTAQGGAVTNLTVGGGGGGMGGDGAINAGGGPNGGNYPGTNGGFGGGGGRATSPVGGNGGFGGGGGSSASRTGGNGGFGGGAAGGNGNGAAGFGGGGAGIFRGGAGAGMGGAIFNAAGAVTIINSTLSGNAANGGAGVANLSFNGSGLGGAVFNLNGSLNLRNSTLAGNTVTGGPAQSLNGNAQGGALYTLGMDNVFMNGTGTGPTVGTAAGALVTTYNSIFANSVGGSNDFQNTNSVVSGGNNLATATNVPGVTVTTPAALNLGLLASNGGPTRTMLPGAGSTAISAGNTGQSPGPNDQRGLLRVVGGTIDIGAVEVQAAQVVIDYKLASQVLTVTGRASSDYVNVQTPADNTLVITATDGIILSGDAATDPANFQLVGNVLTINTGNRPASTFTINLGDGVDGTEVELDAAITNVGNFFVHLGGQDGDSAGFGGININGDLLAAGGSLIVNPSASITTGGGDIDLNGVASQKVGMSVRTGATLDAGGGNVTLTGTGFNGTYDNLGIDLNSATVKTTGLGAITITGTGGNGSLSNNPGVVLRNGAQVTAEDGGIRITGQGGGSGSGERGVSITRGILISATGAGAVSITGTGGASGTYSNHGVFLHFDGVASRISTESGLITIAGVGGGGSGMIGLNSGNQGVSIFGFEVSSGPGGVSITGQGDGASSGEIGVLVGQGAKVTATGAGAVSISGSGGTNASYDNHGVFLTDTGTQISTKAGLLTITGTGGGSGSSAMLNSSNLGVLIDNSVNVQSGEGGISITGSGGGKTAFELGVSIRGAATVAATDSGNVAVTGTGSGLGTYGNAGVSISGDATTVSTDAGELTITGSGGGIATSLNHDNVGVRMTGGQVTSSDGNITITGSGGGNTGAGSSLNHGVYLGKGNVESGSGGVTIVGTGGEGNNGNRGVFITGPNPGDGDTTIKGHGGDIEIAGTGNGSGGEGIGVQILRLAAVTNDGDGDITISGSGSAAGSAAAHGVFSQNGVQVSTVDGDIAISGTSGGASGSNIGVYSTSTTVQTTGDGNIAINGHGGGAGGTQAGIYLGGNSQASAGGAVTITGSGGNGTVGVFLVSVQIDTIIAGPDQPVITGTGAGSAPGVILDSGVTLNASLGFEPTTDITLIHDEGDPISGTLDNIADSAFFFLNSPMRPYAFIADYAAGTNNQDLVAILTDTVVVDYDNATQVLTVTGLPDADDIIVSMAADNDLLIALNSAYSVIILTGDAATNAAFVLAPDRLTLNIDTSVAAASTFFVNLADGNDTLGFSLDAATPALTGVTNVSIDGQGGEDFTDLGSINVGGYLAGVASAFRALNATIQTNGGAIDLDGAASASSSQAGIEINHSTLDADGGDITLTGTGGAVSAGGDGVEISYGSVISTTGAGKITITGTGGGEIQSLGVDIAGGSEISTENGLIAIAGTASGGEESIGVKILVATIDGGSGGVTISGTGGSGVGSGSGNLNMGVAIGFATVTALADVEINGVAGGNGIDGIGVYFNLGATVQSTGSGGVTIRGTGSSGNSSQSGGVVIDNSFIESQVGDVVIEGTGGDGTNGHNTGVSIQGSQVMGATAGVSITGHGGAADYSYGVSIGGASTVSTRDGDITITGTGSGYFGDGVALSGATVKTVNANIKIDGLGGDGGDAVGTNIDGGSIQAGDPTFLGKVTITGSGGQGGSGNIGVMIDGTAGIAGILGVEITGTGGAGDDSHGVLIDSSTVTAVEVGNSAITGSGGTGSYSYGVRILGDAKVRSTALAGDISISGTGGTGSLGGNVGVSLESGVTVEALVDGAVHIHGEGGEFSGEGVYLDGATVAANEGAITIEGSGATGMGGHSQGVQLVGNASVLGNTGGVAITGVARASGGYNNGVEIENGVLVSATGAGAVTITGTGSNAGGGSSTYENNGVEFNDTVTIRAEAGGISIIGSAGSGLYSYGLHLDDALISATSTGKVTIAGSGGAAYALGNGVGLHDSTVTTEDGDIEINGSGAGYSAVGVDIHNTLIQAGTGGGTGGIKITGTGSSLESSYNQGVVIHEASELATGSGDITIAGSGGSQGYGSDNDGVKIYEATTIHTTSGKITITGSSGGQAGNAGVGIADADNVVSTDTGDITIIGTGGTVAGTGGGPYPYGGVYGVVIGDSQVTSNAGKITIAGSGGQGPGSQNVGVALLGSGTLVSTGTGGIAITGTGGGDCCGNTGVLIEGADVMATTTGAVDIVGSGGGAYDGVGVLIIDDFDGPSTVSAQSGQISITGIGANGSGGYNAGVVVEYSTVSGMNGGVVITGTGQGSGENGVGVVIEEGAEVKATLNGSVEISGSGAAGTMYNDGVAIFGKVSAANAGTVTITGTAGAGTGDENVGVFIEGTGAEVHVSGNALTITGSGGGVGHGAGIRILDGAQVTTISGGSTVTLRGTGAAGAGENNIGVEIQGSGTLVSSLSGGVRIFGSGGGSGYGASGVVISDAAAVRGVASGPLTIVGTGSSIGALSNFGVLIEGTGTLASVVNNNMSITGSGGGTGQGNSGVVIRYEANVTSTGAGAITITGTAASASTGASYGVSIEGTGTTVAGSRGDVAINGIGQGTNNGNHGVVIKDGADVTVAGTGAIARPGNLAITGTGSSSGTDANRGVVIIGDGTLVSNVSGNVSISGSGGGSGTTNNDGVSIRTNAMVETTGTGEISVTGTAGAGDPLASAAIRFQQATLQTTGTPNINLFAGTGGVAIAQSTNTMIAGGVDVETGTFSVDGPLDGDAQVNVKDGARLRGTGTISGAVSVEDGGTIAPGNSSGLGTLGTGNLTLVDGASAEFTVNGITEGIEFGQISVTGDVVLGDSTGIFVGGIGDNPGQVVALIKNDGGEPVDGEFIGRAEGSTVTINGVDFVLSYMGPPGTAGNDVTLAQQMVPSFGGLTSQTITYGEGPTDFAGTLMAGSTPATGTVTVTISGNSITPISNSGPLTAGSFTISIDTSSLPANANPYTVTYSYPGDTYFTPATDSSITLTVDKADQTINWSNPVIVTYGSPLGAAQLNASVTAPGAGPTGALTYTPPAGTVLTPVFNQTIQVDAAATGNYNAASKTVYVASANELFVRAVYHDVLGRNVDPTGLATWRAALDSGASRSFVVSQIVHSLEYYATQVVESAYLQLLGRPADPAGSQGWSQALQNGTITDNQFMAGLLASAEFIAGAGATDLDWLSAVYTKFLGRPLDPTGQSTWLAQLGAGVSKFDVALSIASGAEHAQALVVADYPKILGRPVDAVGLATWTSFIVDLNHSNEDVIVNLLLSDEYAARLTTRDGAKLFS